MSTRNAVRTLYTLALAFCLASSATFAAGTAPILGKAEGGTGSALGVSPTGSLTSTPSTVINITDPQWAGGAKCDGTTNDNAAINAAIAGAWTKLNTSSNGNTIIKIVGPADAGANCRVTQINATGLSIAKTGSKLIFDDLRLNCSATGNTNFGICFDATFSRQLDFGRGFQLTGSGAIGLQIGNTDVSTHDCCFITGNRPTVSGNWSFAAVYNDQGEGVRWYNPYFQNGGSSTGPIAALGGLGTITGGAGGTSGVYTNVALTGGTGAGALANITVAGGAVTSVYVTYQGKGYTVGNALSAASASIGNATGFSVPVAAISPFTYVIDGSNHWRHQSAYQTITDAVDTFVTLTQNSIDAGDIIYGPLDTTNKGVPLWISYARAFNTRELYLYSSAGAPDIEMFDNSAAGSNVYSNAGMTLDYTPEAGSRIQSSIFLYGSNPAPTLNGLRIRDYADNATYTISADSNITSVAGNNIDWAYPYFIGTNGLSSPAMWTLNGRIDLPTATYWSATTPFTGLLCTPTCSFYGTYQGNAAQLNFFNNYSGASAIMNFGAPNTTTSATTARFFRTDTHGGLLQVFKGDNSTSVQDNFSSNGNSFMQSVGGQLAIGTGATSTSCGTGVEVCILGGAIQPPSYTVATLPTCGASIAGAIAYVTDATSPAYNATLTGGGAIKTLAMCNGSAWTAH